MVAPDSHVLRRALIGGYRVADVEVALASLSLALSQLQLELEGTRRRLAVAESRRGDEVTLDEAILRVRREHEAEARAAGERLEAAEAELAHYREAADDVQRIRERLTRVIRELARELQITPATPEAAPRPAPAEPLDVFDTSIELEAWPFRDLAALMQFETSLHALPGVNEVYIRGFEAGRATIELALDAPSPLLQEMALSLPYRLDVRSQDRSHISMAVEPAALSA